MTTAKPVQAIIVDDEIPARKRIRNLLKENNALDVVAEASNGLEALELILKLKPDLIFLDIQMPRLSGFDLIDLVGADKMPVVVFVTAFDNFAVKAFDVNAVDYLLKPFDPDRFKAAVDKAINEISRRKSGKSSNKVRDLISFVQKESGGLKRILVKDAGAISIIETDKIDWIETAGNYIKLYVGKKSFLVRQTMKNLAEQLDSNNFVRIHRTTIVKVDQIVKIVPFFSDNYEVHLKDGTKLNLSRRYAAHLKKVIGTF